jgi:hypothetical protein
MQAHPWSLNTPVAHISPNQPQTARAKLITQDFLGSGRGGRGRLLALLPPSENDIDDVFRFPEKVPKLTKYANRECLDPNLVSNPTDDLPPSPLYRTPRLICSPRTKSEFDDALSIPRPGSDLNASRLRAHSYSKYGRRRRS